MLPETSDLPMHVGDVSFSLNEMQADPDLAFRTQSRVFDEGEHFIFLNVFFSIISAIKRRINIISEVYMIGFIMNINTRKLRCLCSSHHIYSNTSEMK
jgi:hypothetical protein